MSTSATEILQSIHLCIEILRVINTITSGPISVSEFFSASGLQIINPAGYLAAKGIDINPLKKYLPIIHEGSILDAPFGAIQDPAGSAVNSNKFPSGSGASGAIYAHFANMFNPGPHGLYGLEPIPKIPRMAAVFNSTPHPGKKVLHSYSPDMSGNPSNVDDRVVILGKLATTYYNAIREFSLHEDQLDEDDQTILNLIPVGGAIYAQSFIDGSINHLHPSYTIMAIIECLHQLVSEGLGGTIPQLHLYFYASNVYVAAVAFMEKIKAIPQK